MAKADAMVPADKARQRLRLAGFSVETRIDGAKRSWLVGSRIGRKVEIRVFSGNVFEHSLERAEKDEQK